MPVTVHTPSPALNTDDNNPNTNFRVFVKLSAASNGQIRVRFHSATNADMLITGAAFGKWDGNTLSSASSDMTTTPFRLTFGGSNSTTVTFGTSTTSDFITHTGLTLNANDWLIVTFFHGSASTSVSGERYSTSHSDATTMFNAIASDRSQDQFGSTVGGWSIVGSVQPGGSGGYNFGIGLVETNDPAATFIPDNRPQRGIAIMAQ